MWSSFGSRSASRTGYASATPPRTRFSISGGGSCRLRRIASLRSFVGCRTTSVQSSRASIFCGLSRPASAAQPCPMYGRAATSSCGCPVGPRSNACCRLLMPSRRSASTRRRRAGLLAPRPQSSVRQRSAADLHAWASSGLVASAEGRTVIDRLVTLLTTLGAAAVVVSAIAAKPAPVYIWNASESVPIGLYRLHRTGRLSVTQLVALQSPEPLATFLADRRYLPRGIPLLKRVLALPGQTVCRDKLVVTVDKIEMGAARARDRSGRLLPIWQGCHVIAEGEVFLMNWQSEDSFDGRYFGALPTSAIIGTAEPLWIGEEK